MNILFLTMNTFTDIEMHNIYSDLMKEFILHGHRPYIVTPRERKTGEQTQLLEFEHYTLLKVRIGNSSDVSLVEKGITTVTLSSQYYRAVKQHLGYVTFDLMLYSTPPITLAAPVKKLKKHFGCKTYLMLKDIFPQNAVDLEMFSQHGLIYRYFRQKETLLYKLSDRIGCMSQANVEYILRHNPWLDANKVEVCPNGIIPNALRDRSDQKKQIRERFSVPDTATVYLYGGNLGKPQGIPHLVQCLRQNMNITDRFFIICGSGSEYELIAQFVEAHTPTNIRLLRFLPKQEYDALAAGCDAGLIFLDSRFTIPNYPSRILSYMENEMPVLVCADGNTDVGLDAVVGGYGIYCSSEDPAKFTACVDRMCKADLDTMGKKARKYLEEHFAAKTAYERIWRSMTR